MTKLSAAKACEACGISLSHEEAENKATICAMCDFKFKQAAQKEADERRQVLMAVLVICGLALLYWFYQRNG